ncbi:unnamed protein product [Clonostachys byssicola]|uniref:Heterokaryon incompatibility domain-containing protein n=1 Tax=Clonostachys byssicola TaxID=160290 RepID=A0A9N9UB01_9HYPO|nr:unnamed protein product [Clonostachys byssicola]
MTTLDYSDVPLGPNEIRLVSLEISAEDVAQAKWKIRVANLADESTSYYAVSYRWGAPLLEGRFKTMTNEPVSPVQFNNSVVKVTENLYDFLDQVKSDEQLKEKEFWIDAICINQSDPKERSHQVSTMMARIYRSATCVIAWLGDADLHTERAFDHLSKLAESTTLPPPVGTKRSSTNQSDSVDFDSYQSSWKSTAKLFERTYWNRSWIIQELVLPDKVTVRCGKYSADWSVLSKASHNISTSTWREFFFNEATGIGSLGSDAKTARIPQRNYGIPTILKATKASMATEHWTNVLLYTLIRSRDFEATNWEDKVYALMGLIEDSVDIGKTPLLRPEFGEDSSAAQTYLKTAIQLLRDCEELLILSCVEGRSFQKVKINGDTLPSWVPDWSEHARLGLGVTGYKRYSADACFVPPGTHLLREEKLARWPAVVNEESLTVSIGGLKVDEISFRAEPKRDIQKGEPFPRLLSMLLSLPTRYQTTEEDLWEAFWRTLIVNTGSENLQEGDTVWVVPRSRWVVRMFMDSWTVERF